MLAARHDDGVDDDDDDEIKMVLHASILLFSEINYT